MQSVAEKPVTAQRPQLNKAAFMKAEIQALTGLRGIAALWVLTQHVSDTLLSVGGASHSVSRYVGAGGFLGVDIFFVLSGFVLALNYSETTACTSIKGYGKFLWKRLARIYPMHIAALVLFCLFLLSTVIFGLPFGGWSRLNSVNLAQHLTLTHAWAIPIPRSWNAVSWSISAEWVAYLCFPVLATMAARFRSVTAAIAMIALLFCALASIAYFGTHRGTMAYGLVRIAVEFPAGILLYRIWTLRNCTKSKHADVIACVTGTVLFVAASAIGLLYSQQVALATMPILTCVLVYAIATSDGCVNRFLSSPSMLTAGRLSYSFYLVHVIFLGLALSVLKKFDLFSHDALAVTIVLASVVAAGLFSAWAYHYIEEPARRAMLRVGARSTEFMQVASPAPHPHH